MSLAVAIGRGVVLLLKDVAARHRVGRGPPPHTHTPPQVWAVAEGRGDGLELRVSSSPFLS